MNDTEKSNEIARFVHAHKQSLEENLKAVEDENSCVGRQHLIDVFKKEIALEEAEKITLVHMEIIIMKLFSVSEKVDRLKHKELWNLFPKGIETEE